MVKRYDLGELGHVFDWDAIFAAQATCVVGRCVCTTADGAAGVTPAVQSIDLPAASADLNTTYRQTILPTYSYFPDCCSCQ